MLSTNNLESRIRGLKMLTEYLKVIREKSCNECVFSFHEVVKLLKEN